MDFRTAKLRAGGYEPGEKVKVGVDLATGTLHRLTLYRKIPNGSYEKSREEGYPSRAGQVELDAEAGNIVHQRTLSPASAEPLDRYGVVLPGGRLDWGTEVGRLVDFGPVGSATRPGFHAPAPAIPVSRGRVFVGKGDEVVGGAVSDVSTTSGD